MADRVSLFNTTAARAGSCMFIFLNPNTFELLTSQPTTGMIGYQHEYSVEINTSDESK